MIQRIQTIWLLLAAGCAALTLKFSFFVGTRLGVGSTELMANDNIFITILTSAVIFTALIAVSIFKNRKLQMRLSALGLLIEALVVLLYYEEVKKFSTGTYTIWAVFHMLIFVLFLLALRGIRKDDKLIKDSDRLR